MSELLSGDKKHVRILEDIQVDVNLPKFKDKPFDMGVDTSDPDASVEPYLFGNGRKGSSNVTYERLKSSMEVAGLTVDDFNVIVNRDKTDLSSFGNSLTFAVGDVDGNITVANHFGNKKKHGIFKKISSLFNRKKEDNAEDKTAVFDVLGFFSDVKNISNAEIDKFVDRTKEYVECIGFSEKSGQTALKERLIDNLVVNKYESVLYAKGLYKAINENAVVMLAENSEKAISLDYIKNYGKMIPVDVIRKKIEIDKLHIFDNYCVMYYDPDGKTYIETKEEEEKRKDPILFGLIKGSKKLYYICDWVDEYCDLTLDKVVEIVGKEKVEEGFITDRIGV